LSEYRKSEWLEAARDWLGDVDNHYSEEVAAEMADFFRSRCAADTPTNTTYEVLRQGKDLVESTLAHISHGGPTREDAEKWLEKAAIALAEPAPVAAQVDERRVEGDDIFVDWKWVNQTLGCDCVPEERQTCDFCALRGLIKNLEHAALTGNQLAPRGQLEMMRAEIKWAEAMWWFPQRNEHRINAQSQGKKDCSCIKCERIDELTALGLLRF
jgi:hypothetical protein